MAILNGQWINNSNVKANCLLVQLLLALNSLSKGEVIDYLKATEIHIMAMKEKPGTFGLHLY